VRVDSERTPSNRAARFGNRSLTGQLRHVIKSDGLVLTLDAHVVNGADITVTLRMSHNFTGGFFGQDELTEWRGENQKPVILPTVSVGNSDPVNGRRHR